MMDLTKCELEVMHVIWAAGRPLSRSEIIKLSTRKSWKDSSIHILLNGLLRKEAIKEDGFVRCNKTYGRLYSANISCEDYFAENVFAHGDKASLPVLFSAFIRSEDLTVDMLDEFETLLQKRRQELK